MTVARLLASHGQSVTLVGHFQAAADERLVGLAGKADAEALVADASSERRLAATARASRRISMRRSWLPGRTWRGCG
jgi:hypothetical protein